MEIPNFLSTHTIGCDKLQQYKEDVVVIGEHQAEFMHWVALGSGQILTGTIRALGHTFSRQFKGDVHLEYTAFHIVPDA